MGRKPETSVICFARLLKTRRTECSRSRQTRSQNWLPTRKPVMRSMWPFSDLLQTMRCSAASKLRLRHSHWSLDSFARCWLQNRSLPFLKPLLIVVSFWLVIIFLSFTLIAPCNATATFALIVSAVAVATAIFLILELDRPFNGLLRIPSERILNVLSQLQNQGNK